MQNVESLLKPWPPKKSALRRPTACYVTLISYLAESVANIKLHVGEFNISKSVRQQERDSDFNSAATEDTYTITMRQSRQ
jgi:hypothetical protein